MARKNLLRRGCGLALLWLLAACADQAPDRSVRYVPRPFSALPGWGQDDLRGAAQALRLSCAKARDGWQQVCAALPDDAAALPAYFTTHFQPWQVMTAAGEFGLFTGYYAPEIRASRTRQGIYQTPLYSLPPDLAVADLGAFKPELRGQRITGRVEKGRFVPYPDRARITAAGLDAPVLAWAADPVDVFFLQVQGSGRAVLEEGGALDLGYAGQNGRPYVAIGKVLKEEGVFGDAPVTMPLIRAWLAANPARRDEILNRNPSYVFFRPLAGPPQGAQGVALTPERSLAVDPAFVTLGAPVWLDAAHPDGGVLQRLYIAQDTGGAIKGPVRGDVYWGFGAEAAERAGKMQSRGRLFTLLPQGMVPDGR